MAVNSLEQRDSGVPDGRAGEFGTKPSVILSGRDAGYEARDTTPVVFFAELALSEGEGVVPHGGSHSFHPEQVNHFPLLGGDLVATDTSELPCLNTQVSWTALPVSVNQ